jgi:hypothetical protein
MVLKTWGFGDKVVHSERPEWGIGQVTSAIADTHEGRACQRLTIRFDRAGVKNLNSALAKLIAADDAPAILQHEAGPQDPLLTGSTQTAKDLMLKLPGPATDPFSTPRARLVATLKLYRFSEHGGALIDWAAAQSGLKDPMTRFSRHELEDLYKRFVMFRDDHLRKVMLECKRDDQMGLAEEIRNAPRSAQQVIKRLDLLR